MQEPKPNPKKVHIYDNKALVLKLCCAAYVCNSVFFKHLAMKSSGFSYSLLNNSFTTLSRVFFKYTLPHSTGIQKFICIIIINLIR